jgi:hypothetical protein
VSLVAWPLLGQTETFASRVLKVQGMAPGAGAAFDGDDEIDGGEVWIADAAGGKQTRLDKDGGYRTPVLAPGGTHVYALHADAVVRIPAAGGDPEEVLPLEGVTKLVGFAPDGRLLVMVDAGDPPMIGLLAVDTRKLQWLTPDMNAAEDQAAIARIRNWERVYGEQTLSVDKRTEDGRRWTDVFLRASGKESVNVSRCEKATCGQGSLSPDGKSVLYIRAAQ